MKILIFFTILYVVVSGAPEFKHSADSQSSPKTAEWENSKSLRNRDIVKRNHRQNSEPTLNGTSYENLLLNTETSSNLNNMNKNEKYSYYNNYDEGNQSFLLQYDQKYPPYTHYDYKPSPASPPPPCDHQPPPPHYEHRPPPPYYGHRPPPPHYGHRPPPPPSADYDYRPLPPHHDYRPSPHYNYRPPPPHYEHGLPPPLPPSPHQNEPSRHHYNTYDYNNLSSQLPSDYDDRHIRQSPYYDRSYSRGLHPPPRNEGRTGGGGSPQYHYDDRPPPPYHDGPPPPHNKPLYNHNSGPHYPPPPHDDDRPAPPPRHDGRPPPPHDRPRSFHDENRHPPPSPGDRSPNYNTPSNDEKLAPDDPRFLMNQHDHINSYRHLQDEGQQSYNGDKRHFAENIKLSQLKRPHEQETINNIHPLQNINLHSNNIQFDARESLDHKIPNHREPLDLKQIPFPENRILSMQRTPLDPKMLPDNRYLSNNGQPRDKRKPSDVIGPQNNQEALNDLRPNGWENTRGQPNYREIPDKYIVPHDRRNPSCNYNPVDSSIPFNDKVSDGCDVKEARGSPDSNGAPHIKSQSNDVNMQERPPNGNIPDDMNPAQFRESNTNRDPDFQEPLLKDNGPSANRNVQKDRGPPPGNRGNIERANSWDQPGIKQRPDSREPPNRRDLSDNRNPSSTKESPYTGNESQQSNREYIIDNLIFEDVKIAKPKESLTAESNKSSTNLQNLNFDSTDNSINNNSTTTSTISPLFQVSAVTPAS